MPLPLVPLIWIGIGAASIAGANALNERRLKSQGWVGAFPGEGDKRVSPKNGSIVCCEVYEVLDHTGIWCDGQIVELNGNGLVRAISPGRFLNERSGSEIYIACGDDHDALAMENIAQAAISQVYTYRDYALLKENCHGFVAECLPIEGERVISFSQLNELLADVFRQRVHWQRLATL